MTRCMANELEGKVDCNLHHEGNDAEEEKAQPLPALLFIEKDSEDSKINQNEEQSFCIGKKRISRKRRIALY